MVMLNAQRECKVNQRFVLVCEIKTLMITIIFSHICESICVSVCLPVSTPVHIPASTGLRFWLGAFVVVILGSLFLL